MAAFDNHHSPDNNIRDALELKDRVRVGRAQMEAEDQQRVARAKAEVAQRASARTVDGLRDQYEHERGW